MERKQPGEGNSQTGDHRGGDLSGHQKEATWRGALTNWRPQRVGLVRTQKGSDQVGTAHFLAIREGLVGTRKESNQVTQRGTHFLEMGEGGTCQDMEKKQPSRAPTIWRQEREGLVRAWKESNRVRGTYQLETTEGQTCQDMEQK